MSFYPKFYEPVKYGLSVGNISCSLFNTSENRFCLRHPLKVTL